MSPFPASSPAAPPAPRRAPRLPLRTALAGLLVVGAAVALTAAAPVAAAGDPPEAPAAPSASPGAVPAPGVARAPGVAPAPGVAEAAPSPRATAVESEVRALERVLSALRRARTDLRAGRPEALPVDDAARRAHEAETRALREVVRYEALRSKAVAALVKATEAKDAAKVSEARAALETLDGTFVAALERVDSGKSATDPSPGSPPKANAPKAGSTSAGSGSAGSGSIGSGAEGDAGAQKGEKPATRKRRSPPSAEEPEKDKAPGVRPPGDGRMASDVDEDPLDDPFEVGDDLEE